MTRRYAVDEVALPRDRSVSDLDWVGFTWEMQSGPGGVQKVVQFLLAPDAFVLRQRLSSTGATEYSRRIGTTSSGEETVLDLSANVTRILLSQGYAMKYDPMLVDFTINGLDTAMKNLPGTLFNGQSVKTLGDAVEHCDDNILGTIIAYAAETSSAKVEGKK